MYVSSNADSTPNKIQKRFKITITTNLKKCSLAKAFEVTIGRELKLQ
jgi:hypothetical protein